jgi:hypothetical protein
MNEADGFNGVTHGVSFQMPSISSRRR